MSRSWGTESESHAVALGLAVALSVVAVDHLLVGELSLFFDLCFITLCLALAVRVREDGWFVMGLYPPVLMLAVFVLLGLVAPQVVAEPDDGVVQAVISGLTHHSAALLVGYALSLAAWWRRSSAAGQPSNRDGSPDPTLSTSG
ncbi:DUF6542 domain-containing protein [Nocardioides solisilvae]|uniref:DUF6542 domain-containing protein n=1 Tax=Nocardioides solisilvae TaxID=1542435 RepID=UPI0013A5B66C|nr:DUF6542 domain-containing protein [Nocardioides solisilvae]